MIPWLHKTAKSDFPEHYTAQQNPDGLLAAGGDLTSERLIAAYKKGIFPWYSEGEPILWWTPSQRMVIYQEDIHISRSMKRFLKKPPFELRVNTAFKAVVEACALPRDAHNGTWIDDAMINAYTDLHQLGLATSVECWQEDKLVGGIYGVHIGQMYFGESMFSRVKNASKSALIYTARELDIEMIDCQFHTDHLASMGAKLISREQFLSDIKTYMDSSRKSDNTII